MNTPLAEQVPTEHYDLGPCSKYWDYRDESGVIVLRVCRWEQPGGKKDIRPVIRVPGGWAWKHHPDPRPLWQLDVLAAEPDRPVIVVEGEKAAEAAQKLFPSHIATTWPGGAESMGKADWLPITGRSVILIPDCDAPGRKAMEWVRTQLQWISESFPNRRTTVRIVDPVTIDPKLADGWDMADAVKEGRDVSTWLLEKKEDPAKVENQIEARTFEWIETASIPPREWLYGRHYMRGMVSATAGIGGAGKSTLLNVELVSMAIGRDLLNDGEPLPTGPLYVWGHNGEDPYVELQRRIMAVCRHYGVTREDLGDRLKITSGRDSKMLLARELKGGGSLVMPTETGDHVATEISKRGIQVFVVDPFVTIHQVNENDNGMIDDVMTILRDLADKTNCAVEVAHHFRKLNGDDPSVDSIRGASSIVGAARSARIVAGMTREEASKYSIEDEKRGYYSWLMNGKANMLPPTHRRQWMKMESVGLGNAKPPFKADEIGVITRWEPPETQTDLNGPEYRALRRAITEANPLTQLRASSGAEGWIGNLMAKALGLNPADSLVITQMKAMTARLLANGTLVKENCRDHGQGRMAPVLRWAATGDQE